MSDKELSFPKTREAMAEFDRTQPERDALWDSVETNADIDRAREADVKAADRLREAFYQDTCRVNNRQHCELLSPDDIKRVLRGVDSLS